MKKQLLAVILLIASCSPAHALCEHLKEVSFMIMEYKEKGLPEYNARRAILSKVDEPNYRLMELLIELAYLTDKKPQEFSEMIYQDCISK